MKKYYIKLKNNEKLFYAIKNNLKFTDKEIIKLITQGSVWVNNTRVKVPDFTITDQLVVIYYPEKPIEEYTLKESDIIYEDQYMMVVHKDAGLNSCPSPMADIDCLSHGVNKYYRGKGIKYIATPINRLDKPVKGLLFFAKDKLSASLLHNMFRKKSIRKLYLVATENFNLSKKKILIKNELEWKGKKQKAATYIKFIKKQEDFLYFIAYPLTGRTHQIRKHFANYLYPIFGDSLYGGYKNSDELKLYCFYYRFIHPFTLEKKEICYIENQKLQNLIYENLLTKSET